MGEIVRIRAPLRTLLPFAWSVFPVAVSSLGAWLPKDDGFATPAWLRISWIVFFVIYAALATTLVVRRDGVDLTDDALVIVSPLRRSRRIAWRDIQALDLAGAGGAVRLHLTTGRRRPLRLTYPSRRWFVPGSRVAAEYHAIGTIG